MNKQRKADLLLLMVTGFWGISYFLVDLCLTDLQPQQYISGVTAKIRNCPIFRQEFNCLWIIFCILKSEFFQYRQIGIPPVLQFKFDFA